MPAAARALEAGHVVISQPDLLDAHSEVRGAAGVVGQEDVVRHAPAFVIPTDDRLQRFAASTVC